MKGLYITDHAENRFKERAGLPKRVVAKSAAAALERGVAQGEATGALRRYMDALYLRYGVANNVRIYCGNVYIFCGETLITIFALPQNLRKIAATLQGKKKNKQK